MFMILPQQSVDPILGSEEHHVPETIPSSGKMDLFRVIHKE